MEAYSGGGGHFKQESQCKLDFLACNDYKEDQWNKVTSSLLNFNPVVHSLRVLMRDNWLVSNLQCDYGEGYGFVFGIVDQMHCDYYLTFWRTWFNRCFNRWHIT